MLSNTATPKYYHEFRMQVLNGEIPVCEEISEQMNRIDDRIANPMYYYDDEAIDGYILFCETEMTLTDGSPMILTDCFKLWAEDLLAWFYFEEKIVYNPRTRCKEIINVRKRLTVKQLVIDARGSAKSMYASSIQQYVLVCITKSTHQIVVAPTMKQAEETLEPIRTALVRQPGPLYKFLTRGSIFNTTGNRYNRPQLVSTKKGIQNLLTNSLIEIRPMRIDKLQGLRPYCSTIDEWLSGAVKEDPIGSIEQGASKMDDYILVATSSEGTTRNGAGDDIKMEAKTILRGQYQAEHVSIWHYKLDHVSEVAHPELWLKCNSNLGVTISYEAYHRDVERMEANPAVRNDILAKRFGLPVSGTTYFFTYEETMMTTRRIHYKGSNIALGADMSRGNDFCSYVAVIPLGGDTIFTTSINFISEDTYSKLSRAQYDLYSKFIREGSLITMPGITLKMGDVYDEVFKWLHDNEFNIVAYGFDSYGAYEFNKRYVADFGEYNVFKIPQGFKTESVPLQELKDLAAANAWLFDQEIIRYAMENTIAIVDNNYNIKLSKNNYESKIDPVAGTLDGYIAMKKVREEFE